MAGFLADHQEADNLKDCLRESKLKLVNLEKAINSISRIVNDYEKIATTKAALNDRKGANESLKAAIEILENMSNYIKV
jgi:hypothetical protein